MKYNKIIKPTKFDRFTNVPNYIFRHKGISIGATGLYAWMFSHRHDQQITVEFMINHFKESKSAVRAKLNELIDKGYVDRIRVYDNGRIKGYNYKLKAKAKKLETEKLETENLALENQPQSNTNNNIYNISNTNTDSILPHFIKLFDKRFHPTTKAQKQRWLTILDQLQRLDKYDLREVYKICKHIRQKDFWKTQLLSLPKLRNPDKNGDKWINRFEAIYKDDHKPDAYKKIKDLIEFKLYTDIDGQEKLGAVTKLTKLNQYNLTQVLSGGEILQVIKYLKNE
tara:strand:- start:148 stop:996 length:849 start_codon:yes stop_codon:yes gene_type:complete